MVLRISGSDSDSVLYFKRMKFGFLRAHHLQLRARQFYSPSAHPCRLKVRSALQPSAPHLQKPSSSPSPQAPQPQLASPYPRRRRFERRGGCRLENQYCALRTRALRPWSRRWAFVSRRRDRRSGTCFGACRGSACRDEWSVYGEREGRKNREAHGNVDFPEHSNTLDGVFERYVLRSRYYDSTCLSCQHADPESVSNQERS